MTTTVRVKASEITKDWHVIDASDRALGRVASEAARLLRGKHKPTWEPHLDVGDFVIIVNASKVRLSGAKMEQKVYYRHSGYPGGLKSRTFAEQMQRDPAKIIEQAVFGMLPKGPLGKAVRRHLKVYAGPEHPHQSQVTGSERAAEARKEAEAAARQEALASPKPPPRLRPFSRAAEAVGAPALAAAAPVVEEEAAPAALAPEPEATEPEAIAEEPLAEAVEAPEDVASEDVAEDTDKQAAAAPEAADDEAAGADEDAAEETEE